MRYTDKRECRRRLKETFRLDKYRPGQYEAINALLSGRDTMCILPTGAGKSLCWQLPALVHEGLTVVVSPLIALMRDQVEHLRTAGIEAVSLDSLMLPEERRVAEERIRSGAARIVFVSPERLQAESFRRLCDERSPWLVVVDEAHCIVQWGGSFRPAYEAISDFLQLLPKRPVLCAMTATADGKLQRAIRHSLGMRRMKCVILPVVRSNLVYDLRTTLDSTNEIIRLCIDVPCRTVIFCRSRMRAEHLSARLTNAGANAEYYHAGMTREARTETQQRFADGDMMILCATIAFGMGIDVPDIRRIIHDEMPDSVIDYIQQTGRAGRDGRESHCVLFLEPQHLVIRSEMKRKVKTQSGGIVKHWLRIWEKRRSLHQLLKILLTEPCIPAGLSQAFRQRQHPCGLCYACRKGPLLQYVPDIGGMKEWQVRAFLLTWQRNSMARLGPVHPQKIMPDAAILTAAKKFVFPEACAAPDELERLLRHFRRENMHDSAARWI